MLNFLKRRIKNYIDLSVSREIENFSVIFGQLQQFYNSPPEMLSSQVEKHTVISDIIERFERLNIPVIKKKIYIDDEVMPEIYH